MQKRTSRTAVAAALYTVVHLALAAGDDEAAILVTANRFATPDVDAPFASEIHTRKDIKASNSTTLFDYLGNHTSVQVMPSFGNRMTPKLDMRGYGLGDGYQNIVVSVDGLRLNNIDMSSQLIGAIPIGDVERIEITKGSGSVLFGDGATAGTIQIHTRKHRGFSASGFAGSHGNLGATLSGGTGNDLVSVSTSYDMQRSDGASDPDVTGHKANMESHVAKLGASAKPTQDLTVTVDASVARLETRYPGKLTQAQFDASPAQNAGRTYTYQEFTSDNLRGGIEYALTEHLKIKASRNSEDKRSRFVTTGWTSDYDYVADELSASYAGDGFAFVGGYQGFDGVRIGATDRTSKNNSAWFGQGQAFLDGLTLSLGLRGENVAYAYRPTAGAILERTHSLNGWDVGGNLRITPALSVFANVNRAFQAPDIDRFFNFGGTFNAFISPAKSLTTNIGLNHVTSANRFKLTVFRAKLENEIYYEPITFTNTNIDTSHKYGLELQNAWQATDKLSLTANYSHIRAIIDQENAGGGAYDGKELPGVPRHAVQLGLGYKLDDRSSIHASHAWRSATWAANDFDNNNAQKQQAYASTNVSYRYQRKEFALFAAVENLFGKRNGIWTADNSIYPANFARSLKVGVDAKF